MKTSSHSNDYKKLLMTDAEYEAYVKHYFCVDDVTGEILAERLSPVAAALAEGVDWNDHDHLDEELHESLLNLPKSFFHNREKDKETELGR